MPLRPEDFEDSSISITTGFTYRNIADVPGGLRLPPEVLTKMAQQLERFDEYKVPPADHDQIIARGLGGNAVHASQNN